MSHKIHLLLVLPFVDGEADVQRSQVHHRSRGVDTFLHAFSAKGQMTSIVGFLSKLLNSALEAA